MKPEIVADPFQMIIDCFHEMFPGKYCQIFWTDKKSLRKSTKQKKALGVTEFPDDGTFPVVWVCCDQTVMQAMDILSHELAHVAAGTEADHGPEWEKIYANLYEAYCQKMKDRFGGEAPEAANGK